MLAVPLPGSQWASFTTVMISPITFYFIFSFKDTFVADIPKMAWVFRFLKTVYDGCLILGNSSLSECFVWFFYNTASQGGLSGRHPQYHLSSSSHKNNASFVFWNSGSRPVKKHTEMIFGDSKRSIDFRLMLQTF